MLPIVVNRGKGAALRTGFASATGDVVIVQDADLEYGPMEIPKVSQPIDDNKADVVFGSRFMGGEAHRVLYYWHSAGNRFLTMFSNWFASLNLADMETCYKAFRREALVEILPRLQRNRFGFEPEITSRVARLGYGSMRLASLVLDVPTTRARKLAGRTDLRRFGAY